MPENSFPKSQREEKYIAKARGVSGWVEECVRLPAMARRLPS